MKHESVGTAKHLQTGDQLVRCSCCGVLRSIRKENRAEEDKIALQKSSKTLKFSVIH